jgi:hypothetical protein
MRHLDGDDSREFEMKVNQGLYIPHRSPTYKVQARSEVGDRIGENGKPVSPLGNYRLSAVQTKCCRNIRRINRRIAKF